MIRFTVGDVQLSIALIYAGKSLYAHVSFRFTSLFLSVCLSFCVPVSLSFSLSLCISLHLSLSLCLTLCLSLIPYPTTFSFQIFSFFSLSSSSCPLFVLYLPIYVSIYFQSMLVYRVTCLAISLFNYLRLLCSSILPMLCCYGYRCTFVSMGL